MAKRATSSRSAPAAPGFISPQLATLRDKSPSGSDWIHEIKYDGYRLQIHIADGKVSIFTRGGLNWTHKFGPLVRSAETLKVAQAIIDGELVVQDNGRTDFSQLQADLSAKRIDRLQFYAFDLLFLNGRDLRNEKQIDRKAELLEIFRRTGETGRIVYSQHLEQGGAEMFTRACELNWEGIISKRRDAPYRSTRNEAWLKIKCVQSARFPIVGFVPALGGIAALYLGRREGRQLVYAGKVGTGFSMKASGAIRMRLNDIVTDDTALTETVRKPKARWVAPKYLAAVDFRDITADGKLRHCSFKGLYDSPSSKTNLI